MFNPSPIKTKLKIFSAHFLLYFFQVYAKLFSLIIKP